MTREEDVDLSDASLGTIASRKASDIKKRVELMNSSNAEMILSIHQNHFSDSKYSGAQMFCNLNPNSKELADLIQQQIKEDIQPSNTREVKQDSSSIYLLKSVELPIVIVECGFISNYDETDLLVNSEYQKKIAYSIFLASTKYLETK